MSTFIFVFLFQCRGTFTTHPTNRLHQGSEFYIRNLNDFKNLFPSHPRLQCFANPVVSSETAYSTDPHLGVNICFEIILHRLHAIPSPSSAHAQQPWM